MLLQARAYVDSREVAQKESRDVIAAREIFAEVGEVAAGTKPGRRSEEEVSLFKSAASCGGHRLPLVPIYCARLTAFAVHQRRRCMT